MLSFTWNIAFSPCGAKKPIPRATAGFNGASDHLCDNNMLMIVAFKGH